jgi:CrcB protein
MKFQLSYFPLGTFVVNILGSFFIGFLYGVFDEVAELPIELKLFAITGFLGALTTFSTFAYESFELLESMEILKFFLNIAMNIFGTLIAVLLGIKIAEIL